MTPKKKTQNGTDPELQTFLDNISAKYRPEPEVLQRRIDAAVAHYNCAKKFQQFADIPARLIEKLQVLILEGWRYNLANIQPLMSNPTMISVSLQKPESMIAQELKTLRSNISEKYHDELFEAMEAEIDILMSAAAEDARRKADEKVTAEQSAMRDKLRTVLSGTSA